MWHGLSVRDLKKEGGSKNLRPSRGAGLPGYGREVGASRAAFRAGILIYSKSESGMMSMTSTSRSLVW